MTPAFRLIIFDAMQSLNENGILILASVTGGERKTDAVPSDKINQMFVLGNRAMVGEKPVHSNIRSYSRQIVGRIIGCAYGFDEFCV